MKMIKPDSQLFSRTPTTDQPTWARPATTSAKAKADPRGFGYPSARPQFYHPPTDVDRTAEEPERWDGLS
jgi:hypothetical protein